jgi:tRNA (adenine22-N1)-methyltransferase
VPDLGPRLSTIASFVSPDARVADVGTDHGRLAAHLVARGAAFVIATDRSLAALANATSTLAAADGTRFELRCGDGLGVLQPHEVDTVVLAGMGGATIRRLLDAAPVVVAALARLVVQPEGHWLAVRKWIAARGATLIDEVLVRDGARFRLVCAIDPNRRARSRSAALEWSEIDLRLGPLLARRGDPTWRAWIAGQIRALDVALADAAEGGAPADRIAPVRARRVLFADALARVS